MTCHAVDPFRTSGANGKSGMLVIYQIKWKADTLEG